jgi:Tfp pilus assembly protein PilF
MRTHSRGTLRSRLHRAAVIAVLLLGVAGGAGCSSSSHKSGSPSTTTDGADKPTSGTNNAAAVQTLLQEGIRQAETNMLDQATTTFNNVLVLSPNNVYALYNLGVIAQDQNNDVAALSYYNKALSFDGTYTPAMYNKAIILESTDPSEALSLYKQIVIINPSASTAYLRMAFIYAKQGQTALATAARAKAISLNPSLAQYQLPAACSGPSC